MNSFNIRQLSNSNMGELQVQIPHGWTLKFKHGWIPTLNYALNMGELKFKSHVDELSNSNMGKLELSIIHSQIQHGWTQVQIPCGWTLKFNMGELKLSIMHSQIQHGWTQVQIPYGWALKFIMGWTQTLNYALSISTWGELKTLNIMYSQIQHGWTWVQIQYGCEHSFMHPIDDLKTVPVYMKYQ